LGRRERDFSTGNIRLKLNISDDWLFSDEEAGAMAASIFGEYERVLGSSPSGEFVISIRKFPIPVNVGNWEADTRGRSITLVSSDMPFKSQSLQRLHEQMRHEIFHFWIPNGVNLSGNYDWFYEGFALYQSLKVGVAVNRIRFDDFLDTLSRAYNIDTMQSKKISLIDASKNRWSGANTQIYARGMLVAFLCDLALLDKSKGKRSTTDLLRNLYERHRPPNAAQDGNAAILALLRSYSELIHVIDRNITGSESIDWAVLLKAAGLEAELKDQLTNLKVTAKPSGRQKELLDKLGYNSWRKLSMKQ
jgi:predicted metalloprotease with PDZ domain